MSFFEKGPSAWEGAGEAAPRSISTISTRTLSRVVEEVLIDTFTRKDLEIVLLEELGLTWTRDDIDPTDSDLTKRELVRGYIRGWVVPQLVTLAGRIDKHLELSEAWAAELHRYVDAYQRGGGVANPSKNLIFAANGPKPEIVLRDAVSNDIAITANAQYCLVYDQPVPPEGLRFARLVEWWRALMSIPDGVDDRGVALRLHDRFLASLDSGAERVLFEAYASRYKETFDMPALIPQVYLHYDPYDQRTRRASATGAPLARQRMDFLMLFSDRQRVVIEVDGKHHYAEGANASPARYAEMVSEDRRLRLSGYEVYRFGGYELTQRPDASAMVQEFFEQLADRMK